MSKHQQQASIRSAPASAAFNQSGAGPMKDRRTPRGGSKNLNRIFLEEYMDYEEVVVELSCSSSDGSL